jgi:hypothetical protein
MNDKRADFWLIAIVVLMIFLVILGISELAKKNNVGLSHSSTDDLLSTPNSANSSVIGAGSPSTTTDAFATPGPNLNEVSCGRPYPASSIWNTPIDWSIAKVHPMSDLMMAAFFKDYGWIGTDASRFTPNVYWATNKTPLIPVTLIKYRFRDAINDNKIKYGEPGDTVWMPLPLNARPAVGTDGQLVVINTDTGEEWGLNNGFIDISGNWFAGGIYRYSIHNSGIPPEGFAQRGAGIGQLAGIIRRCEVDRGYIAHAVTIAYDFPCAPEVCQQNGWPASIPPFRKTDGKGLEKYDIPEGARMAIRPEITKEDIVKVCDGVKGCIVWVLNMQEYGGFIVDDSGHPKTYAEGDPTANWEPSVWNKDILMHIPSKWYVVIDWNIPSTKAAP